MLEPHEFLVGSLHDTQPGALVLPRHKYDEAFLTGSIRDVPMAVFLNKDHAWRTMPCEGTVNWRGVIVPGITVVADHESVINPEQVDVPLGSAIRRGGAVGIRAVEERGGFRGQAVFFQLATGLPTGDETFSAAFLRWQVVLGRGEQRRVLYEVDLRKHG